MTSTSKNGRGFDLRVTPRFSLSLSLSFIFYFIFILFLFYFYTFLNPVTKERDNASIGIGTGFDSIYFL
jgi:hypothetical protein